MNIGLQQRPIAFNPDLDSPDPLASHWLRQATLRLRREICWRWSGEAGERGDALMNSLDLTRYRDIKQQFFEDDPTARYLSDQIAQTEPLVVGQCWRGSFGWLVDRLELDAAARFILALALLPGVDSAAAAVIAAAADQPGETRPTLALVQTLWDEPVAPLELADSGHPLLRHGLVAVSGDGGDPWRRVLAVHPAVVRQLLTSGPPVPDSLRPLVTGRTGPLAAVNRLLARDLVRPPPGALRFVPVLSPRGGAVVDLLGDVAEVTGRAIHVVDGAAEAGRLVPMAVLAWLRGIDLFVPDLGAKAWSEALQALAEQLPGLPATIYCGVHERHVVDMLPHDLRHPALELPALDYEERLACWHDSLGDACARLGPAVADCARRFRYEVGTIRRIAARFSAQVDAADGKALIALCRAEVTSNVGDLAQPVTPRFDDNELVLPPALRRQFDDIYRAMTSLGDVHYRWGTAKAWNESGISVLFSGPPGSGKTMAAEVLARRLDLPMYRIDLSQVVSKYIGETEKNLRRLFDVADVADCLLFFDEADALFGRRTEVKDAHDRYANLEISYLLERMERFRGLAILATSRRKDLDDAFLRRLRDIVEFPVPGPEDRAGIWRISVPEGVRTDEVDFAFLAERFALTGGHIRSIVFNACLQAAADGEGRRLTMEHLIVATKREYDKLNRSPSHEQFGRYGALAEALHHD
jgi:hypothetical protein